MIFQLILDLQEYPQIIWCVFLIGNGGLIYQHPEKDVFVRVMPPNLRSGFPAHHVPYVVDMRHGAALDKLGTKVLPNSQEAHIPLKEYLYFE